MKVMRNNDAKEYEAAKHFKMAAMRLQGKESAARDHFRRAQELDPNGNYGRRAVQARAASPQG